MEQFKKLPDWNRWPMPETFYTTFNIAKPKPAELQHYLNSCLDTEFLPREGKTEFRPPAEGGVRTLELPPLMPVETEVVTDAPAVEEPARAVEDQKPVEDVPLQTLVMRSFGKKDIHFDRVDKVDAQAAVSQTE